MKTTIISIALAGLVCAQPAVTEPITVEALQQKQTGGSALANLDQVSADAQPAPRATSQSIISQSEILHDGTNWTLVPRGAVLFVPAKKADNVGARPVGNLLQFSDFLAKNPAWVSTHETSFQQASGKDPISSEKTEFWAKQDKVIIAVHQGGPISVRR